MCLALRLCTAMPEENKKETEFKSSVDFSVWSLDVLPVHAWVLQIISRNS